MDNYFQDLQRPYVNNTIAIEVAQELFELQVQECKELESYDDRNFLIKGKLKTEAEENLFVLKVFTSLVSTFGDSLRINADIVPFVNSAKLECPVPQTSIYGTEYVLCRFNAPRHENTIKTPSYQVVLLGEEKSHDACAVQLVSFVHGVMLSDVTWSQKLMMEFGSKSAQLHAALKQYNETNNKITNDCIKPSKWPWMSMNLPQAVQSFVHTIKEPEHQSVFKEIAQQFQHNVLDKLNSRNVQLIHGDFSCQNAIARKNDDGEMQVVGVIDFGDKECGDPLVDLGYTIGYTAVDANKKNCDIVQVTSHVMAGYQSVVPLTESDIDIVLHAALGRLVLSNVIGAYQYSFMPDNEYLLLTSKDSWEVLQKLQSIPKSDILKSWKIN